MSDFKLPWDQETGNTWVSDSSDDRHKPDYLKTELSEQEIMELRIILGNALNGNFTPPERNKG